MIQSEFIETAVTDSINAGEVSQAAAETVKELSLWDLCLSGGFIMIPLVVLAIVCIYIFVERAMVLHRASRHDDTFMRRIKDYIHDGEIESARNLCRNNGSPYARLIGKGISRIGRPMNDVLVAIENHGQHRDRPARPRTSLACHDRIGSADARLPRYRDRHGRGVLQHGGSRYGGPPIGDFADGIYTALVTTVAGLSWVVAHCLPTTI